MIYEVINPSDCFTIEAEDGRVALVVCILLGDGKLFLEDEHGEKVNMPAFAFMSGDVKKAFQNWLNEVEIGDLDKFIEEHIHEVNECLTTIVYGPIGERKKIIEREGVGGLEAWNKKKRGSINDYDAYARSLAKHLRRQYLHTDVEDPDEAGDDDAVSVPRPTRGIVTG